MAVKPESMGVTATILLKFFLCSRFLQEGMTSLHISSERTGAEDILLVLVSALCDVNARNKLGRTALHLAAKQGNLPNLKTLLDAGCDRNIKDKLGFTAVGLAFKFNQKASADVYSTTSLSGINPFVRKLFLVKPFLGKMYVSIADMKIKTVRPNCPTC